MESLDTRIERLTLQSQSLLENLQQLRKEAEMMQKPKSVEVFDRQILMLLGAISTFQKAINTFERASETYYSSGPINNIYGDNRRLKVARWTVVDLAIHAIQDSNTNRTWIRKGIPTTSKIIGCAVEANDVVARSNICVIFEDEGFEPVSNGVQIPELNIVMVDVKRCMEKY